MIMKDAENTLKDCLKSIKPIVDRDDVELIIADTGSDDTSKKIASDYTDKIFDYNWNDNFAEARNFTLEKAEGEWIFILDTDEIVENCSEIVNFIQNNRNCSHTYITYRTYSGGKKEDKYSEHTDKFLVRLFKKENAAYEKAIYETLINLPENIPLSKIIIQDNSLFTAEKFYYFDNLAKKEYDKNKTILICEKLMRNSNKKGEADDIDKYLAEALDVDGTDETTLIAVCVNAAKLYLDRKEYYQTEKIIEKYFNYRTTVRPEDITIYYYLLKMQHDIYRFDEMDITYNTYCDLYEKFRNTDYSSQLNENTLIDGTSECSFRIAVLLYTDALIGREEFDKAHSLLEKDISLDIYKEDFYDLNLRIRTECELINRSEESEKFKPFVDKCLQISNRKTIDTIDGLYKDIQKDYSNEFKAYYDCEPEDSYGSLLKLRYADLENKTIDNPESLISKAMENYRDCNDILYFILKYNYDITNWADNIDPFYVKTMYSYLPSYQYSDILQMLIKYMNNVDELNSIKDMIVVSCFYDIIFRKITNNMVTNAEAENMFINYVSVMIEYMNIVYNPDLFNDDDIYDLPSDAAFAYFGLKAINAKNENNISEYLANLNKALKAKNEFNPIMIILLAGAKEYIELLNKYSNIKKIIKFDIENNKLEEARQFLMEYSNLNPNDPDLEILINMFEEANK